MARKNCRSEENKVGTGQEVLGIVGAAGITLLCYELGRVRDQPIPGLIFGGLASSLTLRYLLPGASLKL